MVNGGGGGGGCDQANGVFRLCGRPLVFRLGTVATDGRLPHQENCSLWKEFGWVTVWDLNPVVLVGIALTVGLRDLGGRKSLWLCVALIRESGPRSFWSALWGMTKNSGTSLSIAFLLLVRYMTCGWGQFSHFVRRAMSLNLGPAVLSRVLYLSAIVFLGRIGTCHVYHTPILHAFSENSVYGYLPSSVSNTFLRSGVEHVTDNGAVVGISLQ
jgi:hypothetical protein